MKRLGKCLIYDIALFIVRIDTFTVQIVMPLACFYLREGGSMLSLADNLFYMIWCIFNFLSLDKHADVLLMLAKMIY